MAPVYVLALAGFLTLSYPLISKTLSQTSHLAGLLMPGQTTVVVGGPEQYMSARARRLDRYAERTPVVENGEDAGLLGMARAALGLNPAPKPLQRVIKIGEGDTLAAVLDRSGISARDAHYIGKALSEHYDPRRIKPGQQLALQFQTGAEKENILSRMDVHVTPLKTVSLSRNTDGLFDSGVSEKKTVARPVAQKARIKLSLFGSALEAGISANVIAEAIRIYSWDVDFQRDIRQNDTIEILHEEIETEDGEFVKNGDILYARLSVNGQDIPVYRYELDNGDVDYFTPNGVSIRKALMATPIDGARLSSGYGLRQHPVLGYQKMHKGVDFAAPRGTPIYAAGDGTIERMDRYSSYGNYVRIRHNSTLKTAYAHMKGFASGLSAGKRVKQGQVIGYVGTTGRSTGPHLHYEVLENGAQVNPKAVKLPQGETLKGDKLAKFKAHVDKLNNQYANLSKSVKFAALQ